MYVCIIQDKGKIQNVFSGRNERGGKEKLKRSISESHYKNVLLGAC